MFASERVTGYISDGGSRAKSGPRPAPEGRMAYTDTSAVPVLRHEYAGVSRQRYSDAEASLDCITCNIWKAIHPPAAAKYLSAREVCSLDCECLAGVISSNGVNGSQATETDSGTGIQVVGSCSDVTDALMLPI